MKSKRKSKTKKVRPPSMAVAVKRLSECIGILEVDLTALKHRVADLENVKLDSEPAEQEQVQSVTS
jgi:hypothetical protein